MTSHTGVNDAFTNARIDAWLCAEISAHERYASVARSSLARYSSITGATARPRAAGDTNTLWMYASYFDMRSVRPSSGTSTGPPAVHAIPAGRGPSLARIE